MAIKLKVQSTEVKLKIAGSDAATLKASEGIPIYPDPYEGSYTVTPASVEQTLSTNGLMMTDDVTVEAVLLEEKSVSPSTEEQTVTPDEGYYGLSDVIVSPMTNATPKTIQESTRPNTPTVDANGLVTATTTTITGTMKPILSAGYVDTDFSVPYTNTGGSSTLQLDTQGATTITPSTSEQTVVTAGKYMTGDAKVSAMPNATWKGGSRYEPVLSLSVSDSGLITGSVNTSSSVQPLSASGYAEKTHNYPITIVASNTQQLSTVNGSTVTPTESEQTAVAANKYTLGAVKVGAISSTYVGSDIPVDPTPTASGKTVTIPTGFYSAQTTKDVATGSAGTPTASKGTVSNHSVTVTPSVTNTTGYITGSTKTGTGVSVSASELVSGTKSISANGTNIDVTNYASVDVAVPGSQPTLETVTKSYTPSTSQQTETITPSTGYDGIGEVDVTVSAMPTMTLPNNPSPFTPSGTKKATIDYQRAADRYLNIPTGYNETAQYYEIKGVPNGTVTAPSTITATGATSSASIANQTITLTKTVSVTPSVTTAGYVSSGTAGNASVSLTASDITFRESDSLIVNGKNVTAPVGYYPAQAYASVADGTAGTPTATKGTVFNNSVSVTPSVTNTTGYITGSTKTGTAVTVSASELVSGSETKTQNGTYDVTNLAQLVVAVSGGGGGGLTKIATKSLGTISTTNTSATDTGQTLSVSATAYSNYDMLICVAYTSPHTNGRHIATVRVLNFSATSSLSTKTSVQIATSTQHWKLSSSGTPTMRSGTTPYGVYVNAAAISTATTPNNLNLTIYQRYNSTSSGTINGNYVLDVYGVKIQDLIGS